VKTNIGEKKLKPMILGFSADLIMRFDMDTQELLHRTKSSELKSCVGRDGVLNLGFETGNFSCYTKEAESICEHIMEVIPSTAGDQREEAKT